MVTIVMVIIVVVIIVMVTIVMVIIVVVIIVMVTIVMVVIKSLELFLLERSTKCGARYPDLLGREKKVSQDEYITILFIGLGFVPSEVRDYLKEHYGVRYSDELPKSVKSELINELKEMKSEYHRYKS